MLFLLQWLWKLVSELRGTFRSKCKRCFIVCCLCGRKQVFIEEVRDAKEEKKNLTIIKQIEDIQQGKAKQAMSLELEQYRRLFLQNEVFVGRHQFQELLHEISSGLRKIHKWKDTVFVTQISKRLNIPVPSRGEHKEDLIDVTPRNFDRSRLEEYDVEFIHSPIYEEKDNSNSMTTERHRLRLEKPEKRELSTFVKRPTQLFNTFKELVSPREDETEEGWTSRTNQVNQTAQPA